MIFFTSQIGLLFIWILALVALLTKNNKIAFCLFVFGAFFLTVEVSSVIFSSALIDYKYYLHFNLDVIEDTPKGFFFKEGLILIASFITFLFSLFLFFITIKKAFNLNKIFLSIVLLFCTGLMFIQEGLFKNLYNIASIHFLSQKPINDALNQLSFEDYIHKNKTTAQAGKNIILIALESVEQGFLADKLSHLTPNLRRLSEEMNYYNMKPSPGSGFTIGAIYTYLTGFPGFFKNDGNEVFTSSYGLHLNSLPNVLQKAGYNQLYLLGNPEFGGTDKMLNLMNIEVHSEKEYPEYAIKRWGLHDKDLFELAKKEVRSLAEEKEPFAFYLSTISTHFPSGIFDVRLIAEIPKQRSQLELMVAAVDKHVGAFVDFLEDEGILKNTAIFIVPDHLLMGNSSRVLSDLGSDRSLFLITNAESQRYTPDEEICQIDLPRIMIEGAEIKSNIKFLCDVVQENETVFINENKLLLTQLNEASLMSEASVNDTSISQERNVVPSKNVNSANLYLKEGQLRIQITPWISKDHKGTSSIHFGTTKYNARRGTNLFVYNETNQDYQHEIYDTHNSTEQIDSLLKRLTYLVDNKQYFIAIIHGLAGNKLKDYKAKLSSIGFKKLADVKKRHAYIAISNYGFTSEYRKGKPVSLNRALQPTTSERSIVEIAQQANDSERFIAHAGGIIDGKIYTNSIEAMNQSYKKGFRLFELDIIETSDGELVACHDWEFWKKKSTYTGEVPVELATFKEHKVSGFTPFTIKTINEWFKEHPDAILVTDKINDPEKFISQFIDPSRLMMELFSWGAVKKAQELGSTAIVSENLWRGAGENKLKMLKERKVEYLAVSIKTIEKQKEHFKMLLENDIKVFAFHINFDNFKDESYMVREGLDYCHGLYADDWEFD